MTSERKSVGFGILGTGWVARRFATDLAGVPGARLAAVASRSQDRAEQFAAPFKGCGAYGQRAAILADEAVDVVYIATPPPQHFDDAMACLAAGKAVLCEKPFAMDTQQAATVIDEARRQRLFCMEAMWMRFVPAMQTLKQLVDDGAVGDIRLITAEFGIPTDPQAAGRFFDPQLGGGALLDRAVYPISLAVWLLGKPVELKSTVTMNSSGVDETSAALLRFSGGAVMTLAAVLSSYASNGAVISGTSGRISVREPLCAPQMLRIKTAPVLSERSASDGESGIRRIMRRMAHWLGGHLPLALDGSRPIYRPIQGHGYRYETLEVIDCMNDGRAESAVMPLDDSLIVMETLDAVRRSWSQQQTSQIAASRRESRSAAG